MEGWNEADLSNGGITWGKKGAKSAPRARARLAQPEGRHERGSSSEAADTLTFHQVSGSRVIRLSAAILKTGQDFGDMDGIGSESLERTINTSEHVCLHSSASLVCQRIRLKSVSNLSKGTPHLSWSHTR